MPVDRTAMAILFGHYKLHFCKWVLFFTADHNNALPRFG
jgi:hypothetical protein